MNIEINGVDWSDYIDKYSIQPYHEKVQGPNKGVSMGGTDIFDTVKVKNCFLAKVGLVHQEKYTELMFLVKQDFVTVVYNDPDTNISVTRVMSITAGSATQIPLLSGGYVYKNIELNFRER